MTAEISVMQINWHKLVADFFAGLALLAALPYSLGDVALIIPPKLKGYVATASLIAAFILRVRNSINQPPKQ